MDPVIWTSMGPTNCFCITQWSSQFKWNCLINTGSCSGRTMQTVLSARANHPHLLPFQKRHEICCINTKTFPWFHQANNSAFFQQLTAIPDFIQPPDLKGSRLLWIPLVRAVIFSLDALIIPFYSILYSHLFIQLHFTLGLVFYFASNFAHISRTLALLIS